MSDLLKLDVDLDDMTIDEIDAVEQIAEAPLDALVAPGRPQAKLLRALAVVTLHRGDPELYPINTPDGLAATKLKAGAFRISAKSDADGASSAEGKAGDEAEASPETTGLPSSDAPQSDDPEPTVS